MYIKFEKLCYKPLTLSLLLLANQKTNLLKFQDLRNSSYCFTNQKGLGLSPPLLHSVPGKGPFWQNHHHHLQLVPPLPFPSLPPTHVPGAFAAASPEPRGPWAVTSPGPQKPSSSALPKPRESSRTSGVPVPGDLSPPDLRSPRASQVPLGGLCRLGPPKAPGMARPLSPRCWDYVLFPVLEANDFPNPLSPASILTFRAQRMEMASTPPEVSRRITTVPPLARLQKEKARTIQRTEAWTSYRCRSGQGEIYSFQFRPSNPALSLRRDHCLQGPHGPLNRMY